MKRIMDLAHRLMSKVVSRIIAFAYNPNQAEIFQLLLDFYEVCNHLIQ